MSLWGPLLNDSRRRPTDKKPEDQRGEFERDYDRTVYSSSFRRLKDKAQVFPLERDDFVRTRLTHSLEVSSLGRSFGIDAIKSLKNLNKLKGGDVKESDAAAILSTACLLHDIGNPPFGHFGEESIRSWFAENIGKFGASLPVNERNDFLIFEGNAQGLRVICYTQCLGDDKGLNLTYATLASTIKYPCDSNSINPSPKSRSKFGFFQSEKAIFHEIQTATQLRGKRHPLVFLVEAADDIAYSAIDVEDALKKKSVSTELFLQFLTDHRQESLKTYFLSEKSRYLSDGWGESLATTMAIQRFRIEATGIMFRSCIETFCNKYDEIMSGAFSDDLISASSSRELYLTLKTFAKKHVYSLENVLTLEIVGMKVIHGLLDIFVPAVRSGNRTNLASADGKLFALISPGLKQLVNKYGDINHESDQLHLVVDYISGMTDSFALSVYRRLTGITLDGIS